MKISLIKYNKKFIKKFNQEKKFLSKLGKFEIYHVGSTAILNISGKGWIDILIIVKNKKEMENLIAKLNILGYKQGKTENRYRKFLSIIKKDQQFNLHLILKEYNKAYEQIKFRDFMIKNKEEVRKYEKLKIDIHKKVKGDRKKYKLGKKKYIEGIIKKITK